MDTLAFGCILPATGRIRDFHPLERALAGRTMIKAPRHVYGSRELLFFSIILFNAVIFNQVTCKEHNCHTAIGIVKAGFLRFVV